MGALLHERYWAHSRLFKASLVLRQLQVRVSHRKFLEYFGDFTVVKVTLFRYFLKINIETLISEYINTLFLLNYYFFIAFFCKFRKSSEYFREKIIKNSPLEI